MNVINAVNMSVSTMEQMQSVMNEPIDTAAIQGIRDQLNQATLAAQELDAAMQNVEAPGAGVNSAPVILPVEPSPVEVPVVWQSYEGLDVFTNTGIERFEQEIGSVDSMMGRLSETQFRITQQANESEILSPQASYDIQSIENRVQELIDMINQAENSSLNPGTEEANTQLERLRMQLNQTLQLQNSLDAAMRGMDIGDIDTAYLRLSQNVTDMERVVRDSFSDIHPVEIPIHWNSDTMPVFAGTGIERFVQEVQSANNMLNTLNQTQAQIAARAVQTSIFPPNMITDMNGMQSRLQAIQERIQAIESNPMNMGTDTANAELEQLRAQLNQAVQEQELMNHAVETMDVQAANEAYLRLSQIIGGTERHIRDNVDEQGRFNREIQEGMSQADSLMDAIKGAAATYISIQSVGKVLGTSDELVQTMSRLDMMNDGVQSTGELVNMVYAAAQDARGSFTGMADVVARFGNNARDAFGSSEEVVAFADLVQKQMTIAGASTQEAANAQLQLSQALGSGVLRGDELNSIFEQAPNLIQNIADYLDVPIGQIREMASEGELSADVVKAAIFAASDEINAKFAEMPMTWGQVWQSMQNTALIAFQPVLQRLNDLAGSEAFQNFVDGTIEAMEVLASITLDMFELMVAGASLVADNWSWLSPIIYGVGAALLFYYGAMLAYNTVTGISAAVTAAKTFAETAHAASLAMSAGATFTATAAQYGLNAALAACPVTWIVLAVIALVAVIYAACAAVAHFTGVANSGFGVITGGINVAIQFFKNLGLTAANIALGIGNATVALASNMMTAFHNAICSIQSWFYDLLSTALSVIVGICEALNKLPFVEFDYSGITSAADDYAAKAEEAAGNKEGYKSISDAFNDGFNTFDAFQDGWASDAFNAGAAWGDGIAERISDFRIGDLFGRTEIPPVEDYTSGFTDVFDSSGIGSGVDDIAGNTGAMADAMDITGEELKYLRDIAEQEAINRFTTAEINIEQTNHNNIKNGMDLDGIMSGMTDMVNEAIDISTEGVHD